MSAARLVLVTTVLALVAGAEVARADAIIPPASCPESSTDGFCHGPSTCVPRACTSTLDCNTGEVCAARDLCVVPHSCFGLGGGTTLQHVTGACDASGGCATGESCTSFFVCAPGPVLVDTGPPARDAGTTRELTQGCGCRVGGSRGAASAAIGLLVLAVTLFARRARS
ncbi:MAG: MYXO-CTERM sorting domain-containing protein [Sandaracinus sp.]